MTAWTDERVEVLVSQLLRAGVAFAAVTVLFGLVLALVQHRTPDVHHFHTRSGPIVPALGAVRALDAEAIMQVGLLVLVATPIARVALCVLAFVVQRDHLYTALTSLVLSVLLYGLLAG